MIKVKISKRSKPVCSDISAIIFDFDGVITESVGVKTDAFRELFSRYPEHQDSIVELHLCHGGLSRFKKFDMIHKDILRKRLSAKEKARLGKRFTKLCLEKVIGCKFVNGAIPFLKKFHGKIEMFIVSGTPHDEMKLIVKKRKIGHFFKEVLGSPGDKKELVACVLKKYRLSKDSTILVGDSKEDMDGARANGIRFVFRVHDQSAKFKRADKPDTVIKDLIGLKRYILKGV